MAWPGLSSISIPWRSHEAAGRALLHRFADHHPDQGSAGADPAQRDRRRGDLQLASRQLRALLLQPQGRGRAALGGDVPGPNGRPELPAGRRPEGQGHGQHLRVPEARQLPAHLREPRGQRRGGDPGHAGKAQAEAGRPGALRRRAQEAAAPVSLAGGRGHFPDRGRDPRHPARACPPQRRPGPGDPAHPGAGGRSSGDDRPPHPHRQRVLHGRRAHRDPRGRLPGGPPALLRGGGGPGHRRVPHPGDLRGRPRGRLQPRRISPPTCGPPRLRPRRKWSPPRAWS